MPYIGIMRDFPLWIGGQPAAGTGRYEVRLPFDNSVVAHVAEGDERSLDLACESASAGADAMARLTNAERSDILLSAASLVTRDAAALSELIMLETGKPIKEARVEVDRAYQTLVASAIAARELAGEAIPIDGAPVGKGRMAMTIRQPLGIIGAITPFNFPLNLAMHKVGPALAGGNAVVHKPSEQTPMSAIYVARLITEAGAPDGAYNVITGAGSTVGKRLVEDPRIRMITFTGSVPVGKQIRASAGLKRVTLELGGNAGLIVDTSADVDLAVERAVPGSFSNNGQSCISIQRIYLHERVADYFIRKFLDATEQLRVGHPQEETTDISSLINEDEAIRVESWIQEAVDKGARLWCGGQRNRAALRPAVLADLPSSARISCEEVFGPVVAIYRYTDLDTAIEAVNATPYGLQAGVFTRDLDHAFHAARRLQAGGVIINDIPGFRADNMPYGGEKESGIGREGPRYAVEEMTRMKLICWR
jgi:acyl-CoA reductase-like NAD-dependent aldehyde dehydrogenase